MKWLSDSGWKTVTCNELEHFYRGGYLPRKSVMLTFDDGWLDNWFQVFPVLQEYKLHAHIFLITSLMGDGSRPQWGNGWVSGSLRYKKLNEPFEINLDRTVIDTTCATGATCFVSSKARAWGIGVLRSIEWGATSGIEYEYNGHISTTGLITYPTQNVYHTMRIHMKGGPGQKTYNVPVTATFD